MIRKRLGRFATVFTAGTMALLLLGVGGAVAKTPSGWSIAVTKLPPSVSAGKSAGYSAIVRNTGPSNVNDVTFSIVPTSAPGATLTYFSGLNPAYDCTTTGPVVCYLGTMVAGTTITLTVAYEVPAGTTGTFDVAFRLRAGTGDVVGNNQSRGDAYEKLAQTGIGSGQNFDAGFTLGSTTFATTGSLGRNNKQTTTLDTTDLHIPVTVTDGNNSYPCNLCSNLVGDWSILDVNGGDSGPIKVTLMIWGGSVPGGVQASDLYLLHADGSGGYNVVDQLCDATHSNADCLDGLPTKVGNNYKIVAWLSQNGGLRGIY